ncbi:hypothetical protein [Ramlibacter sp.]|uniref:hypothetical protein n=1 Tax=Ramlibacter sp. TaxID=1917967 RepID=UPI0017D2F19B|nr:hypothetical protein [Ramlibacter sp.]MBA2672773.1 hypothetical protein [Ramlibacter sp.]
MNPSRFASWPAAARGLALAIVLVPLSGCAVISVASAATSVVTTGVGLAVDATVGAVKLTGKAVGAVAGGGDSDGKK